MKALLPKFALFFLVLFSNLSYSQLYVSSVGYVYVADNYLYVEQDINIQKNSLDSLKGRIYLRNESQLLQGESGSTTNSGDGVISVFQEGTSNEYKYNYWCSPVGQPSSSITGNRLFGIKLLNRPTGITASTPASITSDDDGTCSNSSLVISSRWIYEFLGTLTANFDPFFDETSLASGLGFTMKGVNGTDSTTILGVENNPGSNQRYDFRGRPNNGDIAIPIASGNATLTGNPYPSAIDLSAFLNDPDNSDCSGIAYFYEMSPDPNTHIEADYVGSYGVYTGTTGIYNPAFVGPDPIFPGMDFGRGIVPIGQGFMVDGLSTGSVTMKNSYRVFAKESLANNSLFERSATNKNKQIANVITKESESNTSLIRINSTLDNGLTRQITLVFDPRATDEIDRGFDARLFQKLPKDTYFVLNDDKEFVINTITFDSAKRIPIGFNSNKEATFRIKVGEVVNAENIQNIYLHNKKTDSYYDIKNDACEIRLPAGSNNSQYEITFSKNAPSNNIGQNNNVSVFQNNEMQNLTVSNVLQTELTDCSLYDLAGRLIFNNKKIGNQSSYQFSTASFANGIYIVTLTDKSGNQTTTKINIRN